MEATLEIATPDGPMAVLAKRPEGLGPFPVVLMFHDGPGIRDATHEVARRIADAGYYVVVPDRYHRFGRFVHVRPEDLIAAGPESQLMRDFFGMVMATTDDQSRLDVDALLDHLAADPAARPGPMGGLGFCNGVRSMLRAIDDHPDLFAAGVGLHPSFCVSDEVDSPHLAASRFQGRLYLAIGEDDHLASVEHNRPLLDEVARLGDRGEIEVLPGADHGFAMPGPSYQEAAASHALGHTLDLFRRTIG